MVSELKHQMDRSEGGGCWPVSRTRSGCTHTKQWRALGKHEKNKQTTNSVNVTRPHVTILLSALCCSSRKVFRWKLHEDFVLFQLCMWSYVYVPVWKVSGFYIPLFLPQIIWWQVQKRSSAVKKKQCRSGGWCSLIFKELKAKANKHLANRRVQWQRYREEQTLWPLLMRIRPRKKRERDQRETA